MLFIKHFFAFIFAFLVFGSMALPSDKVFTGRFYEGHQENLNPPLEEDMVHALSVIL
jgi:hypothetical protein